jgi:hypothetical protein
MSHSKRYSKSCNRILYAIELYNRCLYFVQVILNTIFAIRESRINMLVMKKHNGMRPQDIVVLLKIISMQNQEWRNIDIANALNLSASEVSEALNRSKIAKLLDGKKKSVNPNSLKNF